MRPRHTILCILLCMTANSILAQAFFDRKRDAVWLNGNLGSPQPSYPATQMNFFNGQMSLSSHVRHSPLYITNSSMCDTAGNLLYYSNGLNIYDATHYMMQNGEEVNTNSYIVYCGGYYMGAANPQSFISLPLPGNDRFYYCIYQRKHLFTVTFWDEWVEGLYYSLIDMSANQGLGEVVVKHKNVELVGDTLDIGFVGAVRHANGRDWWVFTQQHCSPLYYRILLTPFGPKLDGVQSIGSASPDRAFTTGCFSPDGEKFVRLARNNIYSGIRLDYYTFDRCSGLFSDYRDISWSCSDTGGFVGAAISPNSRFLYVTFAFQVYQFDLDAPDVAASRQMVAYWDGFTYLSMKTGFSYPFLAPDGKIYMSASSSPYLHKIEYPDSLGTACQVKQHSVNMLNVQANISYPHYPNFRLGPVLGSACDSLGMGSDELSITQGSRLKAFPNPASNQLVIELESSDYSRSRELMFYDAMGKWVHAEKFSPFQLILRLDISSWMNGIYIACLRDEGQTLRSLKFTVQHE